MMTNFELFAPNILALMLTYWEVENFLVLVKIIKNTQG